MYDKIGICGRGPKGENDIQNFGIDNNVSFSSYKRILIVKNKIFNEVGDYQFFPYIIKNNNNVLNKVVDRRLVFSIVENDKSIIIDDSELNSKFFHSEPIGIKNTYKNSKSYYNLQSNGYLFGSIAVDSDSKHFAQWKPKISGRYSVEVFIPKTGATATVRYIIKPDGTDENKILSNVVVQKSYSNEWVKLSDLDGNTSWSFTQNGYLGLFADFAPGDKIGFDAVKYSFVENNIDKNAGKFGYQFYGNWNSCYSQDVDCRGKVGLSDKMIQSSKKIYDLYHSYNYDQKQNTFCCNKLGGAFRDNNQIGTEYVHEWFGIFLQNFKQDNLLCSFFDNYNTSNLLTHTAIIFNESLNKAFLVKERIWEKYREIEGALKLGAPETDERQLWNGDLYQCFERGYIYYELSTNKISYGNNKSDCFGCIYDSSSLIASINHNIVTLNQPLAAIDPNDKTSINQVFEVGSTLSYEKHKEIAADYDLVSIVDLIQDEEDSKTIFNHVIKKPDLKFGSVSIQEAPYYKAGQTITFNVEILNVGEGSAEGLTFYIGDDITVNERFFREFLVSIQQGDEALTLEPFSSQNFVFKSTLSEIIGIHDIFFILDWEDMISEGNENNNIVKRSIEILSSNKPTIKIIEPFDGMNFSPDDMIDMHAEIFDFVDGYIQGANDNNSPLKWVSSINGVLGYSNTLKEITLSPGNHIIDLYSIDSDGYTAMQSIKLVVSDNIFPRIKITKPGMYNEKADSIYVISWEDHDPDNNAIISLYYDHDNDGKNGKLIQNNIFENDNNNIFQWNTSVIKEGNYYIYGVINDDVNPETVNVSEYTVTIEHPRNPPLTKEKFIVNSLDEQSNKQRSVISDIGMNKYVIVWDDSEKGILGQLFDYENEKINNEFSVVMNNNNQENVFPDIARLEDGYFVVVWQSYKQENQSDIYG